MGTFTWRLVLATGVYRYGSDRVGLHHALRVVR
jgi:hypothetical protein